jgi:hypothetical protein
MSFASKFEKFEKDNSGILGFLGTLISFSMGFMPIIFLVLNVFHIEDLSLTNTTTILMILSIINLIYICLKINQFFVLEAPSGALKVMGLILLLQLIFGTTALLYAAFLTQGENNFLKIPAIVFLGINGLLMLLYSIYLLMRK